MYWEKVTERFYEIAVREVATKQVVPGLMAKAFADNNGDEKATVATYIRLRVTQLEETLQREQQAEAQSRRAAAQRAMAQQDSERPPSVMRLAGRFYGRHPLVTWAVIMGIIVAIFRAMT